MTIQIYVKRSRIILTKQASKAISEYQTELVKKHISEKINLKYETKIKVYKNYAIPSSSEEK